jgi:DNA-binding transcriptional regulator YiaG
MPTKMERKEMNKEKRKKLEAKGWKVTSVAEFLELTPDEEKVIELRLTLSEVLKKQRLASNLTQESFAKMLGTSQSRIAKMESGDKSVTLDLLIRSIFKTGVNIRELSEMIAA